MARALINVPPKAKKGDIIPMEEKHHGNTTKFFQPPHERPCKTG